jgi:hypothetical protein
VYFIENYGVFLEVDQSIMGAMEKRLSTVSLDFTGFRSVFSVIPFSINLVILG